MSINIHKLISEALDGLWNAKSYGGTSDPPRKDFGPQSMSQGYNFPYNQNSQPNTQLQEPPPELPPNLAWPLQTSSADLSDIFMRLLELGNKLSNCLHKNTGISDFQKTKLTKALKFVVKLLNATKNLNLFIHQNLDLGSGSGDPSATE